MLAPHLTPTNVDDLEAAATHKTKAEIEQLVAEHFPQPDVPARIEAIVSSRSASPTDVATTETMELSAPGRIESPAPPAKIMPLAPERYAIQFTVGKDTHDMLKYAQTLLSHAVPSGDIGSVFHRVLELAIPQLEKRKFAATKKPRRSAHSSANPRHIPAHVKQAVWERDGGRCPFVSESGRRCSSRKFLEYDHVDPVARGGEATVARVRLRCRAHNQYEAERRFGTEFMKNKRDEARRAATARAEKARTEVDTRAKAAAAERAKEQDVVPWLRALGFRTDEARRAAALCEAIPDDSLEERVRLALSHFSRGRRYVSNTTAYARLESPS